MTPLQILNIGLSVVLVNLVAYLYYSRRYRTARVQWERRKSSEAYKQILGGQR